MTTNYPAALDAFNNPTASQSLDDPAVPHAAQHANANDAIEAIQAALGVNPQGTSVSVAARLTAMGTWQTYTPVVGGAGWAIGDGVATGKYLQVGKLVHFRASVRFGSTSTYGPSVVSLTLPMAVAPGLSNMDFNVGFFDSSAGLLLGGSNNYITASVTALLYPTDAIGTHLQVTGTTPFAWGISDAIYVAGTYGVA